ncbi:Glucokinase [Caulifigura coniformis]|uniref:Glucokinase n=1 Tax=Caulifigura coniformis TaxID=2527983 RepID=A0A517SDF9_9PLAN|nr:ROK family protein [Caulifigura coniformis]QDT54158.1 Glucokinase [Caulifigura coniformis]
MAKTAADGCWVGFDLGGTKMLAQVYDNSLKLVGKDRKKTKPASDVSAGVARIVETIREALADAQIDASRLSGIGIGCPGPCDMEKGVMTAPPNLAWGDVEIGKVLTKEFGCPTAVINDVDSGMYGEYRFGAAKDAFCALGVFPGTGIGGGCIYRGEILRGHNITAMEIGHCQVVYNGPLCGCGQRGCLESVASRTAIAANAARAALRGDAPHLFEKAGTDLANIRSGALAESIKEGDKAVEVIVEEAARLIGLAVSTTINLLAADVVVLGGGLVEAMSDLFVTNVDKAARKRVMPPFKNAFKVVPAALGDDATAMGAAAWAQHVLADS